MKTALSADYARDIRDFEFLIEKGYVLDVRGQWIPLNEKVKKERAFIQHLQSGEVLISGKWVSITDAFKISEPDESDSAVQKQIEVPEDTAAGHDETQTTFELDVTSQEVDFPPETIMIPAEELLENKPLFQESIRKINHDSTGSNEINPDYQEEIITQETIAMSLHALPEITAHYQKPFRKTQNSTVFTAYSDLMEAEKRTREKRGKIFLAAAIVAIALLISVFLTFRFYPGLFQ